MDFVKIVFKYIAGWALIVFSSIFLPLFLLAGYKVEMVIERRN